MRIVRIDPSDAPFERGRSHGAFVGVAVHELAAIRCRLACEQGLFRSEDELLRVAERHLATLERYDVPLFEELRGIASGAEIELARVVVLNHYTDLKDLDPRALFGEPPSTSSVARDDECSAIVAATHEGALLGQTWDMHGSASPFVVMLHVPAWRERPEAWLLSLSGCLGMAGMNAAGLGITINNLKSNDARVGLVWPALVRRVLAETEARAGAEIVRHAPLGSGHHYLVADAARAIGVETSGTMSEIWAEADMQAVGSGFHHENHCLGREVARVSSISPVSTTLERHAWLESSLRARPIDSAADMWGRLGSHEGYPRSVCTHLASATSPHAMQTCAGIVMNLTARRMWGIAGCVHEGTPVELAFDEEKS